MSFAIWALIVGVLLTTMALSGTSLKRLPLSTAMLYLAAGFALGPAGWSLMSPDPLTYAVILERVTELAVLISLFAVGLKLGLPLSDKGWRLPVRLATVSMTITVALIAAIGMLGLGLSPGAAVLLGAILAPTDQVLASDVQVVEAGDRDRLRFSLTGEGGFNDGAAFPFVMLGLGLLGLHDLGTGGWRWLAVDVLWAIAGAYMMQAVQGFNEQLVRIAEVAVVLVVGAMLSYTYLPASAWWFVPLLFLVARHRFDLLPDVRDQPWPAAPPGGADHRPHAYRGRRVHRAPRDIRDPVDDALCAAQGKATGETKG